MIQPSDPEVNGSDDDHGIQTDACIGMKVGIDCGEEGCHHGTVRRRAADFDGQPVGFPSNDPLTDTRKC